MPDLTARALWLEPPGRAELRREVVAAPAPGEVLVRSRWSAISRGTETLVYAGAVPVSEYQRMRAPFQAGELPGAVKHGYCNVGIIEDGPAEWTGRNVFCLYPHQTRYVVPAAAVVPIPADVPPARAVLAANLETAINATWDAAPRVGDRISVVGGGVLGSLVTWLCAGIPGTDVELVDINPDRAVVAVALGARFATPPRATTGRDLVFDASASPEGPDAALELAGREAEVIELSWLGTRASTLHLGGAFHSQRLAIRASQVGTVAPARAARWSFHDRLALAVRLCADPRLDVLFAPDATFDELPAVMARLAQRDDRTLCQRIIYPE